MRVNVQLIDAETGNHLWAERFDKPVADLFDMQDEIVARLSNALNTQLITAEARRAERAPRPDSMDHYFQGMAWLNKGLTPDYLARAENFFERALSLDAGNVEALVGIALVNCNIAGHPHGGRSRLSPGGGRSVCDQSAVPRSRPSKGDARPWASRTSIPTEPRKESPNANGRWRWIEIWPLLTATSGWPNFSSVGERRARATLKKLFD
jgi:hypothetical protein